MSEKQPEQLEPGWGKSPVSRKWHYFTPDGMALCGRVGFFFGPREQGNDSHSDNCAECKRRKAKL
jgi:hypothetical protein